MQNKGVLMSSSVNLISSTTGPKISYPESNQSILPEHRVTKTAIAAIGQKKAFQFEEDVKLNVFRNLCYNNGSNETLQNLQKLFEDCVVETIITHRSIDREFIEPYGFQSSSALERFLCQSSVQNRLREVEDKELNQLLDYLMKPDTPVNPFTLPKAETLEEFECLRQKLQEAIQKGIYITPTRRTCGAHNANKRTIEIMKDAKSFEDEEIVEILPLQFLPHPSLENCPYIPNLLDADSLTVDHLAKTSSGRHVLLQQSYESAGVTCAAMLILDLVEILDYNSIKYEQNHKLKELIQNSGFTPLKFEISRDMDIEETAKSLQDRLDEYGPMILYRENRRGYNNIILDEISIENSTATIRDPFHGWAITIKLDSLLNRIFKYFSHGIQFKEYCGWKDFQLERDVQPNIFHEKICYYDSNESIQNLFEQHVVQEIISQNSITSELMEQCGFQSFEALKRFLRQPSIQTQLRAIKSKELNQFLDTYIGSVNPFTLPRAETWEELAYLCQKLQEVIKKGTYITPGRRPCSMGDTDWGTIECLKNMKSFADEQIIEIQPLRFISNPSSFLFDELNWQFFEEDFLSPYSAADLTTCHLAKTVDGRHVLLQPSPKSAHTTCLAMLIQDLGESPDYDSISSGADSDKLSWLIQEAGFTPLYFQIPDEMDREIKSKLLQKRLKKNGSILIDTLNDSGRGAILLDSISIASGRAKIRDPFHGWAITVKLDSLLDSIQNGGTCIQFKEYYGAKAILRQMQS